MRHILIAEKPACSYGMPWKGDAPCFNFNMPNEHFRAYEIENRRQVGDRNTGDRL